jgi:diguanylate cyclase (GGDEF)-like protein
VGGGGWGGPGALAPPPAPITEGVSGQVISTGRVVAVEDGAKPQSGSQLAPTEAQALLGVPIREHSEVVGSLLVGSMQPGRRWTPGDCDLMVTYAEHVSVAVTVAGRQQALRQAFVDSLTGLGNRGLLLDRLQHELVRADRGATPPTILFLDIDRFKAVNDALGHSAGDQLLTAVAERFRHCVREEDLCARLGGDEFAVLLAAGADPDEVAQRIIAAISFPFEIAENEISISVSIGVATGLDEAETLLRHADVAMYEAKRAGAGRFGHYRPSTPAPPRTGDRWIGGTLDVASTTVAHP